MLNANLYSQGLSGKTRMDIPSMVIKTEEMIRNFENAGNGQEGGGHERLPAARVLSRWRQELQEALGRKRHEIEKEKEAEKIIKTNGGKLHAASTKRCFQMAIDILGARRKELDLEKKMLEEVIRRLESVLAKEGMEIFRSPEQPQDLPRPNERPFPFHDMTKSAEPWSLPQDHFPPPPLSFSQPSEGHRPGAGVLSGPIGGINPPHSAGLDGLIALGALHKKS